MTLRDKICASGVNTLREFICTPCDGSGDGEIIYIPMQTLSGDLEIVDYKGDVELAEYSGDLEIVDYKGDVELAEYSGDLEILDFGGDICQQ